MSNTGFKGVDVRQTGNELVFRSSLKDQTGVIVTTGTTSLYIYEVQSDGSFKSYDFNNNTFTTSTLTTATATMSHQTGNNGATNTGIWTYSLSTLTGFTTGGIYVSVVTNTAASPPQQEREFQYGGMQGDILVTAGSIGQAYVQSDVTKIATSTTASSNLSSVYTAFETGTAQAGGVSSITLRSGASATNSFYNNQAIFLLSGTGAGQTNNITAYTGSTKVATVETAWATQSDNTSVYFVVGRIG